MKKQIVSFFMCIAIIFCVIFNPIFADRAEASNGNPYSPSYTDEDGVYHPGNCTYQAWEEAYYNLGIKLPAWKNAGTWCASAKNAGYTVIDYYEGAIPPANCIIEWNGHVGWCVSADRNGVVIKEGNIYFPKENVWKKVWQQYWTWEEIKKYRGNPKGFITFGGSTVGKSTISVSTGNSATDTKFTWTKGTNAKTYNLRIKKNVSGTYKSYSDVWSLKTTSHSLTLPAGSYSVYVDGCNGSKYTASNTVYFTIKSWHEGQTINNLGDDFYARMILTSTNIAPGVNSSSGNVENVSYSSKTDVNYRSQSWNFIRNADGSYRILNLYYNGQPLEAMGTTDGSNVALGSAYKGTNAQHWYIYGETNGKYFIRNKASDLVLNVEGGKSETGTNLQLWKYMSYSVAEPITIEKHSWYQAEILNNLGDDFYARIVLTSTNVAPGVNGSTSNVEYVSYSSKTDANYRSQFWHFTRNTDGSYRILNTCYNDRPLEAAGTTNGSNVEIGSSYAGKNTQHWYIYGDANGKYIIRNKASDLVLNVDGAKSTDGTNLQIWKYMSYSAAEPMTIEKHTTHLWNSGTITKSATCTTTGTKKYVCQICGKSKTETIAKLGHKNGSWTIEECATMSEDGLKIATCTRCGVQSAKRVIPEVGTMKLSKTKYVYNGEVKNPKVTIKDDNGNVISSENYTVKKLTKRKLVGEHSYKVVFKNEYKGSKKLYFTINPKATSITKKPTAYKKAFTAKWKKISAQATGYQIKYSTSKKFTSKSSKTVTVKSYKTTSKKITKLKAEKTYYVKVRTYKTVNGKKYYSAWSEYKTVKTK